MSISELMLLNTSSSCGLTNISCFIHKHLTILNLNIFEVQKNSRCIQRAHYLNSHSGSKEMQRRWILHFRAQKVKICNTSCIKTSTYFPPKRYRDLKRLQCTLLIATPIKEIPGKIAERIPLPSLFPISNPRS